MQDEQVESRIAANFTAAVRTLLSDKHLYQSVTIDTAFLDEAAAEQHKAAKIRAAQPTLGGGGLPYVQPLERFRDGLNRFMAGAWYPSGAKPLVETETDLLFTNNKSAEIPSPYGQAYL